MMIKNSLLLMEVVKVNVVEGEAKIDQNRS